MTSWSNPSRKLNVQNPEEPRFYAPLKSAAEERR